MAERIDISAVIRVADQASGPIRAVQSAIKQINTVARTAGTALRNVARISFAGLQRGLSAIGGGLSKLGSLARTAINWIGKIGALLGLAGIAGTIASLKNYADEVSNLSRMSERLGISIDNIRALRLIAGDSDKADAALNALSRTLTQIAIKGEIPKNLQTAFQKMGISLDDIKQGKYDEILRKIAASFEANTDPTIRNALATLLAGRNAKGLIDALGQGVGVLDETAKKMHDLNPITEEMTTRARELQKSYGFFTTAIGGVKNAIMDGLQPYAKQAMDTMTDWVAANREWLATKISEGIKAAGDAAKTAWGVAKTAASGAWAVMQAIWADPGVQSFWANIKATAQEAWSGVTAWAQQSYNDIVAAYKQGGLEAAAKAAWEAVKTGGKDAFAWISAEVLKIDWARVGTFIGNAVKNAIVAVADFSQWLASLPWESVGETIGTFIGDGIKKLLSTDEGGENVLVRAFGNIADAGLQIGLKLAEGIVKGLRKSLPDWLNNAIDTAETVLNTVNRSTQAGAAAVRQSAISAAPVVGDIIGSDVTMAEAAAARAANQNAAAPAPNLLQRGWNAVRDWATGGNTQTDINVRIEAPPGMDATVTSTNTQGAANVNADVGQSMGAMPLAAS